MTQRVAVDTKTCKDAIQLHGTPLQLYNEQGIRHTVAGLNAAFRAHFPNFKNYFAVKALPNPAILRIVMNEGCGLDCSSITELKLAQVSVSAHLITLLLSEPQTAAGRER